MHAECRTCFEARQRIHARGVSVAQRLEYARQWRCHLRDQYHDRAIYWFCRYASRRRLGILTIIIDSMDKAKFAWPQYPWERVNKDMDSFHRPRLVLTAAIAHGFGTFIFIADDQSVSHGSNAFCDVLLKVIEAVWEQCRRSGVKFPEHLVVQSDNTVAQAKNQYVTLFLAYLVSRYKFRTTNLFFLVVGHTHEDIDQLFGVILSLVLRRTKFQTARHLMQLLREMLQARVQAKGEELHVEKLTHVRDFSSWLEPAKIEMYNAFANREGIEAPHAFTFKLRSDLTRKEQGMIRPTSRCAKGGALDVFCCVQTYMHSTTLQQPPVLVLPLVRQNLIVSQRPGVFEEETPMDAKRASHLHDMAAFLRKEPYCLSEAADDLETLIRGTPVPDLPPTPWLEEQLPVPGQVLNSTGNELFPHLPDTSWQLLVRFKNLQ